MFPFGVSAKSLAMFYRQMATLHGSGVPLGRSLDTLLAQHGNRRLRRGLVQVRRDIAGGATLADAFAGQRGVFPKMHAAIIAAGESSGNLAESLQGLAALVERGIAMRRKITSGLVYPFLLFHAIAIIPAAVRAFVPSTAAVFPVDPLPHLAGLYAVLLGLFVVAKLLRAVSVVVTVLEWVLLALPVLGGIWRKVALARFSRFFATLYRSGLPILRCIEAAGEASGSRALCRAATQAADRVHGGASLEEAFQCSRLFNPMFVNMVATGEESGSLDEMLDKVAEYHESQAELGIETLMKLAPLAVYLAVAAYAAITIIGAFGRLYSAVGLG